MWRSLAPEKLTFENLNVSGRDTGKFKAFGLRALGNRTVKLPRIRG